MSLSNGDLAKSIYYFIPRLVSCQDENLIHLLLPQCWLESPIDTLKVIFYKRDCRGGEGNRQFFLKCYQWIIANHQTIAEKYMYYIPIFGCYKDLLYFLDTPVEHKVYTIFANQLQLDLDSMNRCKEQNKHISISLASKWCPSINSQYDKKYKFCKKLSEFLGVHTKNYQEFLRKQYLSPLREYLKLTETLISQQRWNEINLYNVPKIALKRHTPTFKKYIPDYFNTWRKNNVKKRKSWHGT